MRLELLPARTITRAICVLLAEVVALQSLPAPAFAQAQEPAKLSISILEGEGAINNIRQRVAREAIVQVEDENHKPVAGAAVTFFLPQHGASGVFANGSRSVTVLTDNAGRATAHGIRANNVAGNVEIRVTAQYHNLNASTVIHQQNAALAGAAAGGAISGKLLAVILIGAAAAAGGVVAATRGNGSSTPAPSAPPVIIAPGNPTVSAPF